MNKTNRDIFINIITSILGLIVSTLILLYVYRIANHTLGIEQIGLWSIVTTLTSLGNIGTFGITGSLVKFSAELKSKGEGEAIIGLLNSCIVLMAGLVIVFLAVLYIFSLLFLGSFVDIKFIDLAFALLPYSFFIFFLSTIGYLILSVIEGLNKSWQKNLVVIVSNILLLLFASIWIDQYGIYGIFYAQIVQAATLFFLAFILIRINFGEYNVTVFNKNRELLRRIANYGLKFQSISVLQLMGEPVTKFFLSRYGGLGLVGVFEMASRMVVQVRGIMVAIISNLLPKLVDIHSNHPSDKVNNVFKNVFMINFEMFAFVYGMLILFSPIVVQVWLGKSDMDLISFIQWLSVAWFINSITVVPYIFNLGSGKLNGNVYSHALIGLSNVCIGILIILLNLQPITFIDGWMISLAVGSIFIIYEYTTRNEMRLSNIFSREQILIVLVIAGHFLLVSFLTIKGGLHPYLVYSCIGISYLLLWSVYWLRSHSLVVIKGYFSSFNFLFTGKST